MTLLVLVLQTVLVLGLTAALVAPRLAAAASARRRVLRRHVGAVLVVHLVGGRTLRGVLATAGPDAIELREAENLSDTGAVIPLDGTQVIEMRRLDFFQVLGRATA